MPADRIALTGLTVRGFHGVFDFERREGQDFVVDVVLELDTAPAAATDDLTNTVHYGELAAALAAVVAGEPVNLLETLAQRLADVCLADERVSAATVTVHKPHAPIPQSFADVVGHDHPRGSGMTTAVLSIGSNLGDRLAHLQGAVDSIRPYVVAVSPVYETAPWGPVPQDDFLNAVVIARDPAAGPDAWLQRAHRAEQAAGRTRELQWGPRTLDVDIVSVDDVRSADPDLTLPHPRARERAFVLVPWLAADPAATLDSTPLAELVAALPADDVAGVVRRPESGAVVKRTGLLDLLVPFLVLGISAYVLLKVSYDAIPSLGYLVPVPLAALALVEFVAARRVRAAVRHEPYAKPMTAIAIARCVALGKASSLVGAGVGGAAVALLVRFGPDAGTVTAAGDVTKVAALLLGGSRPSRTAATGWCRSCITSPTSTARCPRPSWRTRSRRSSATSGSARSTRTTSAA